MPGMLGACGELWEPLESGDLSPAPDPPIAGLQLGGTLLRAVGWGGSRLSNRAEGLAGWAAVQRLAGRTGPPALQGGMFRDSSPDL